MYTNHAIRSTNVIAVPERFIIFLGEIFLPKKLDSTLVQGKGIEQPQCSIPCLLLWDKIARPHRTPFGLFYPLEPCFSSYFFIHRTLHRGKIYSVKNN